jgi:hypothetical protein
MHHDQRRNNYQRSPPHRPGGRDGARPGVPESHRQCHQYRGEETPHVHISAARNTTGEWMFSVKDDGIGIDPQVDNLL